MEIAEFLVRGGRVVAEHAPSRAAKREGPKRARRSAAATVPRKTAAERKREIADNLRSGATREPTRGANPASAAEPAILVREGDGWRQYLVISDERVAIVHMKPALLGGWRVHRVEVQGEDDWPGMKRDAIVAWKFHTDDGRTRIAEGLGDFRARLLEVARSGQL